MKPRSNMTQVDDTTRLGHILDAAEKAIKFTTDKSRASLDDDEILGFAIVHLLEIIGIAFRELSAEFTKAHPEIPWAKMASMRNRLIHGYFDVDLDLVWETVKDELPPLIKKLKHISNKETGNASP